MQILSLSAAIAVALSLPVSATDYSLTVYSAAQPGSLSTERLADYGDRLPGYALVRDRREMSLPQEAWVKSASAMSPNGSIQPRSALPR